MLDFTLELLIKELVPKDWIENTLSIIDEWYFNNPSKQYGCIIPGSDLIESDISKIIKRYNLEKDENFGELRKYSFSTKIDNLFVEVTLSIDTKELEFSFIKLR